MKNITLEELLEAGCHFGHQVTRQNPKARDFVFEARDGIHIIDLAKTKEGLDEALDYVKSIGAQNGSLLIVGTKRQAQPIVTAEVKRAQDEITKAGKSADLFSITKHWVGGLLTNQQAVTKNFKKLFDLTKLLRDEDEKSRYTKKELGLFEKERQKLESLYSGVAEMKALPSVVFIVDTHQENLAVREANRMRIPVVGIVDTNADPDPVDYVIPANDDAVGSLQLLIGAVMDAWIEGKTAKEVKTEEKTEKKVTESHPEQSEGTHTNKKEEPKVEKKAVKKKASKKA